MAKRKCIHVYFHTLDIMYFTCNTYILIHHQQMNECKKINRNFRCEKKERAREMMRWSIIERSITVNKKKVKSVQSLEQFSTTIKFTYYLIQYI